MFITTKGYIFVVYKTNNIMKVTKLERGVYKVIDNQGTWIARFSGTYWGAYDCENDFETSNDNSWGISFKTFKELKKYSQSF